MFKNKIFILLILLCLPCIFATDYFYDNFNDSGTYSLGSIYNQNGWNWNAFSTNTIEMEIYNDSGTLVYRQSNVASDYGEETKGVDVPVNDYFINIKVRINSYSSNIGSNYILGDFDNETYDSFKLNCNESGELMINQAMAEAKTAVDNTTACDGDWHIVTLECHEGNNSHVAYVDGVPFGVKSDYAKRESGFGHIGALDTFKDTTSPQSFDMLWINISDNMTIEEEPVPPIANFPSQVLNNPLNNTEFNYDVTSVLLNWTYSHENASNSDTCILYINSTNVNETYNLTNNTERDYNYSISPNSYYSWYVWCNDTFNNTNVTPTWLFHTNETKFNYTSNHTLVLNHCWINESNQATLAFKCNGYGQNCTGTINSTSECEITGLSSTFNLVPNFNYSDTFTYKCNNATSYDINISIYDGNKTINLSESTGICEIRTPSLEFYTCPESDTLMYALIGLTAILILALIVSVLYLRLPFVDIGLGMGLIFVGVVWLGCLNIAGWSIIIFGIGAIGYAIITAVK